MPEIIETLTVAENNPPTRLMTLWHKSNYVALQDIRRAKVYGIRGELPMWAGKSVFSTLEQGVVARGELR